jgi:hypothetical protein
LISCTITVSEICTRGCHCFRTVARSRDGKSPVHVFSCKALRRRVLTHASNAGGGELGGGGGGGGIAGGGGRLKHHSRSSRSEGGAGIASHKSTRSSSAAARWHEALAPLCASAASMFDFAPCSRASSFATAESLEAFRVTAGKPTLQIGLNSFLVVLRGRRGREHRVSCSPRKVEASLHSDRKAIGLGLITVMPVVADYNH